MKDNFNKYYSIYFITKLIIYFILQNTLFIMILWNLSVDLDNDITGYVVTVPLIILISVFLLFTFTTANAITKFRKNDLMIEKNTPHNYFKLKAILTAVSFSLNDLFLHFKFLEHLLSAFYNTPIPVWLKHFFKLCALIFSYACKWVCYGYCALIMPAVR